MRWLTTVQMCPVPLFSHEPHAVCSHQNSADGAEASDDVPDATARYHVAVPNRCHGDDRPPECVRDAGKHAQLTK